MQPYPNRPKQTATNKSKQGEITQKKHHDFTIVYIGNYRLRIEQQSCSRTPPNTEAPAK